jgi:UDP-N-acetyl-D-glucosamine dehydrogenase
VPVPRTDDLEGAAAAADPVILVQQHRDYHADHLAGISKRFFDTRGVTTVPEAHRL